jgi:5,10-methylenetetrahydromethanopterin reductase
MAVRTPAVGLGLGSAVPPEKLREVAAASEKLGYDELWLLEDYFFAGAISAATAALSATARLPVGIGVVSAMVRHPAVLAMEIATIARMYPGRFRPGVGLGVPSWLDQMGLRPKSQLTALRCCVSAVRDLLAGRPVSQSTLFQLDRIALAYPPIEPVPLYMGVLAQKGLALSGEIADGTVLSVLAGEAYLTWACRQIMGARHIAGPDRPHRVTVLAIFSVNRRAAIAKEAVRSLLAFYLSVAGRSPLTDVYGISDELEALLARGAGNDLERAIPSRWVEDLMVAGEPEECVEKIRRLGRAGADSVVLFPAPAEQAVEVALLAGKEVLSRLR